MRDSQGRFPTGVSGNPSGKASRQTAYSVLHGASCEVAKQVVAAALGGDQQAAKLVLEFTRRGSNG